MKLTTENYYSAEADKEYMSVSQYKRWTTCPAAAYAQYIGETWKPETTDALLHGSYFHGLFDGSAAVFLADHPELLTAKGLKTAPIKALDAIFDRVSQDAFFMNAVTGQHEEIYTAELFGIQWKCRVDVVNFDRMFFSDVKTCRSFEPIWNDELRVKQPFYLAYSYDLQLAIYQELIRIATGHKLEAYIPAVTKESVPDYEVFDFNSDDMETHFVGILNGVKYGIEAIETMKAGAVELRRCERCDYCKTTKRLTATTLAVI